jgi:rare lipoprotein A
LLVACSVTIVSLGSMMASNAEAGYRKKRHVHQRRPVAETRYDVEAPAGRGFQSGLASWYGPGFQGRRTASGERFNTHDLTAAHRSLPFGARVKVINQATGRSVVVRINDRGPFHRGRVIDLSRASATALGMGGTARVQIVAL